MSEPSLEAVVEAVSLAVLREVAGFRGSIKLEALKALMSTLPIVVESAVYEVHGARVPSSPPEPPDAPRPFADGEAVEVWDALSDAWRLAWVRGAVHPEGKVWVKVDRVARQVALEEKLVRRLGGYYGYGGLGRSPG